MTDEVTVERLSLSQSGMTNSIGGGGHTIDGVISTRRGNGAAWLPVIGMPPFGTWELVLPDTPETHRLFKEELVEDILLVVSYSGRIPPWPA
jgi:hypothetical protein